MTSIQRQRRDSAEASGEVLLAHYDRTSPLFLTSPTGTLLAQGTRFAARALNDSPGALSGAAAELFARARRSPGGPAVLVGAVPFDTARPAVLTVPRTFSRARTIRNPARGGGRLAACVQDVSLTPSEEAYRQGVRRALELLERGECEKVVLSRALDVDFDAPPDVPRLLSALVRRNPLGRTFAAQLCPDSLDADESAAAHVLVGASPELLVSRRGPRIVANPLAGSVARSGDSEEDEHHARALLKSEKDLREHAIVVSDVAAALRPFCRALSVPKEPSIVGTPTLWHLSTRITGTLDDPRTSVLALAEVLHPTPAVCGKPRDAARAAIRQLEPFDRGFFTGAVGWCNAEGDGDWIVAIRCAEVHGRTVRLYAGAGIVTGSEADRELAETSTKLKTMLEALDLPLRSA